MRGYLPQRPAHKERRPVDVLRRKPSMLASPPARPDGAATGGVCVPQSNARSLSRAASSVTGGVRGFCGRYHARFRTLAGTGDKVIALVVGE